ncbi:MAG: cyclin-dependent kinase inhibitor 3 family protein [Stenotrophomonas sp.]|uniref:cyclin-dependent kinase inhibitor 3 family protein n=1 Tax=Stenotrophomonas sp. TaxID=69392 RepID=UPI003D6CACAC
MSRTSLSHPLHIAELSVGSANGAIGITFAPGKHQTQAWTGEWTRDLDTDLAAIKTWGATYLISLIEPFEYDELRISQLPARAQAFGLMWHGLPIVDGAAPDQRFLDQWRQLGPELASALNAGARVVVHCKGGLGRAGTVASMLLLDSGATGVPDEAMRLVRSVRPGAIETREQEVFLQRWGAQN